MDSRHVVADPTDCIRKVQAPDIGFGHIVVNERQHQIAQGLETAVTGVIGSRSEALQQGIGRGIIAVEQQLPNPRQLRLQPGTLPIKRTPVPDSRLVQMNRLPDNTAANHCPDVTVAKRQGLFPDGSRAFIPESIRAIAPATKIRTAPNRRSGHQEQGSEDSRYPESVIHGSQSVFKRSGQVSTGPPRPFYSLMQRTV